MVAQAGGRAAQAIVCTNSQQKHLLRHMRSQLRTRRQPREGAASWRQRPRAAAGRASRGALTTIDSPFLTLSPGDLSQDTILPSARASTK